MNIYIEYASLPLRLLLGLIFIAHGYPKITKLKETAKWVGSIGFKPGIFWAFMLSVAEFFGGIAILFGFLTRVAIVPLLFSMSIASYNKIFVWKKPFVDSYEFDLLVLASLIALFLMGAGMFSIDSLIGWNLG